MLFPDFSTTRSAVEYFLSVGAQALVFFTVLAVLNFFVFQPVLKILKMRKEKLDEAGSETRIFAQKHSALKQEYDRRIEGARQLAKEKKEISYLASRHRAEEIFLEAKQGARRDLEDIIAQAGETYKTVLPVMDRKAARFADEIEEKILGG